MSVVFGVHVGRFWSSCQWFLEFMSVVFGVHVRRFWSSCQSFFGVHAPFLVGVSKGKPKGNKDASSSPETNKLPPWESNRLGTWSSQEEPSRESSGSCRGQMGNQTIPPLEGS